MNEYNTYPVFAADQVLTAEHLNQVVNYLDEQGRLTRNRLIGIGIVCGLELKAGPGRIEIGKGCGVTSEGYLVLQERKICTRFRPYSLPEYFSPEYKPVYEKWHMWELLTAEESLELDEGEPLEGHADFLEDKIVVLLLEMKEKPLKNCIEIDCEDKGDKIEFQVKPLLVLREDLDAFIASHEEPEKPSLARPRPLPGRALRRPARGLSDLSFARPGIREAAGGLRRETMTGLRREVPVGSGREALHLATAQQDLRLRRFNVPARALKNTNDVFEAFLRIVNESTLKQLAETLNACYYQYQPVWDEENNPFKHVAARFKDTLSHIKTANPFFIPYFYDWIDDIIKAYQELDCKVFDLQVACCPDRDLFPLHLMLGEAGTSTEDHVKAAYRHYFIYSPLFNGQKDLRAEVRLLYKRLVALVEVFRVPDSRRLFTAELKITPSRYLDEPLSGRCIPYYYEPVAMYPVWSWEKTRRGKADSNLSYHAAEYSSKDSVVNPLNYDIEKYNFFRVEGHIGKPVNAALQGLLTRRDEFNLPFEIAALSTATISAFFNAEDHDCHFRDLESLYQVLLAEMKCKFGEFECAAARIPYQFRAAHDPATAMGNLAALRAFRPGDFLRSHCQVQKGSVGEAYLNAAGKRISFNRISRSDLVANMTGIAEVTRAAGTGAARPAADFQVTSFNNNALYASLFYFIDAVEQMIGLVLNKDLDQLDIAAFSARYEAVMDAAGDLARAGDSLERLDTGNENYQAVLDHLRETGFYELAVRIHALLHVCLDDRLKALKRAYQQRIRELRLLTNLQHYAKKHPGMEHKAGVPKGGTFIMVYHESPPRKAMADLYLADPDFAGQRLSRSAAAKKSATSVAGKGTIRRETTGAGASVRQPMAEEMKDLIREAYVTEPKMLRNFEKALDSFMNTCQDMDAESRKRIRDILVHIPREEEPLTFRVPEEAVIADFYLPYICCSDCAPISYVLPETPRETLSIGIKPTEFCNDDERAYPVSVSPAGGELTASAGGVNTENGFTFSPNGLKPGVNTLKYTLPDGRSTSLDLLIAENFEVDFRTKNTGNLTIQFIPGFSEEDREVIWDFGDGSTSTEFSPVHTYQIAEREAAFDVKLRVSNAPCIAEASHTITVRRPADPEFDLDPRVFCINDRKEYEFDIQPFPKKSDEIVNKNNLIINLDEAAGKLSFVPAKHKIKTTRDYRLEYKGIGLDVRVVVADASFTMQIQWLDVDNLLILKPKQTNASNYTWMVSQGRVRRSFDSQTVEAKLSELKLNARTDIRISLRVNHQLPSGNCADEKEFIITPELFKKFQTSGEPFENTTK